MSDFNVAHVRLAAALATAVHARGGDVLAVAMDLHLEQGRVQLFIDGAGGFSKNECKRIRTWLVLKCPDVVAACGLEPEPDERPALAVVEAARPRSSDGEA